MARMPTVDRFSVGVSLRNVVENSANFSSTITLLFTDIRGFTEYTAEQGDQTAFRMLRKHNEVIRSEIEKTGGREVKTQGDSFMVSFKTARAAVLCAVSIQDAFAEARDASTGGPIRVGIGINTGEPVQEEGDYFGGMVNIAARICAAAGAGEILISESTRQVVGKLDGLDFADRGKHELKGIAEKQNLYSVVPLGSSAVDSQRRSRSIRILACVAILGVMAIAAALLTRPAPPEPRELLFELIPSKGASEMLVSAPDAVAFGEERVAFQIGSGGFVVIQPYGVSLREFKLDAETAVVSGDGYIAFQFHTSQQGYHALRVIPGRKEAWLTLAPYGPHPIETEQRLATAEIQRAASYRISIECVGDQIRVRLNDQDLFNVVDDSVGIGSIEFAVGSLGQPFHVQLNSLEIAQ